MKLLVVLLCRPLVLLSRQLVVESPVITLPSRPLITTPSRHLASPLIILSMHHPLIVSLQRLVVVASPLIAPPSRPFVTLHSRPLVILSLRNPLAVSSLAPSGCCVTSHRAVVSSSRHPLTAPLSRVLPLVAPPSRPLVALPSCPLIVRQLVVAWLHQMLLPPLNAPPIAAIAHLLHFPPLTPPPPLPPALSNASPSCIDKERGSSTTTTSALTAAPP